MALLTSELAAIKYELGYNALSLSALPYAIDGITQLFEQVVGPYLQSGALAYSSTSVAAPSAATPTTLTLTSAVGFSVGDRVVVDRDAAQEFSHVSAVAGSTVTISLANAHAGTYPVTVEGGESIVRGILRELASLGATGGRISRAAGRAGIKSADKGDVVFFGGNGDGTGVTESLMGLQRYWRNELASALGVENLREMRSTGGQMLESY